MSGCVPRALTLALAVAAAAGCRAYDRDRYTSYLDAAAPDAAGDRSAPDAPDALGALDDANAPDTADAVDATVAPDGFDDAPDATDAADASDGSRCDGSGRVIDYCANVPPLAAAPTIDGLVECGLALIPIAKNGWSRPTMPPPSDVDARYALAWRPDGLYVFVAVDTPRVVPAGESESAWCGDAVEVYVDADGTFTMAPLLDTPGANHFAIGAPSASGVQRAAVENSSRGGGYTPWVSSSFATHARADGYDVEAFFAAVDLNLSAWGPMASRSSGFDIAINLSTPPGGTAQACDHYFGQYSLHIAATTSMCSSGAPSCNARALCSAVLNP